MQNREKVTSVAMILLVVFSIGILAGVSASNLSRKEAPAPTTEVSQKRSSFDSYLSDRLLSNLELSKDQCSAIKSEQESMKKELSALRDQFVPAMSQVIEESSSRIENHLNAEQRALLAKNREEMQERWSRGKKSSDWKKRSRYQGSRTTDWDSLLAKYDTNGDGALGPEEIAFARSQARTESRDKGSESQGGCSSSSSTSCPESGE